MLRNYFTIAFRNLQRQKAYSIINILGLSIGIASCILLSLYIRHELSYDGHQKDLNRLYRITTQFISDRGLEKLGTTSPPIGMAMAEEIPEIESGARILNPPGVDRNLIRYENTMLYEQNGFIADSTVFEVLTFDFLEGNERTSLREANSVVLSKTLAHKLFGDEPALDKSIYISQGGPAADYRITGVYDDQNPSHLQPHFITSMTSTGWGDYIRSPQAADEWAGQNFVPAYIKLREGVHVEDVIAKMNQVLKKYGSEDMKAMGLEKTLGLIPVADIYLKSDIGQQPRITYFYVVACIALFILVIACINFMNLSTAKSVLRSTEIGVRKVMGANRSSLFTQLMGEALFIVVISVFISLVIAQICLPFFSELTSKDLSMDMSSPAIWISLAGIAAVTALLAGSYPAMYLSGFNPARVLKGKGSAGLSGNWLRKGLVVFQFTIAIALVGGLLVIDRQLSFMQQTHPGFEATSRIVLPLRTTEAKRQATSLKEALQKLGTTVNVAATEYVPGTMVLSDMMFYSDGGSMQTAQIHRRNNIDPDYFEVMDIKMVTGRKFEATENLEANNIIVNEASARKMGFTPEQMVGQHLYFDFQGSKYTFTVIGVMQDFHQQSLRTSIQPTLFELSAESRFGYLVVHTNGQESAATIASMESIWKSTVQDTPFEYSFLEQDLASLYNEDRKTASIIRTFTGLALLISCLGLFGLSSYMAERRIREIGVRKVLGASVSQITLLMSREFLVLVAIAMAVATPLAWLSMNSWLQGFAYHTSIDGWIFLIAGGLALALALFTVSFESFKAAKTNPADILRTE